MHEFKKKTMFYVSKNRLSIVAIKFWGLILNSVSQINLNTLGKPPSGSYDAENQQVFGAGEMLVRN